MTKTLEEQATEARDQAQAAQQKHQALRDQAQADQKKRDRETTTARLEWARERRTNYRAEHREPVKQARADFEYAVLNNGNSIGAWVYYIARAQIAANAENMADNMEHDQAQDQHDALAAWIETMRPEVEAIATWGNKRQAHTESTAPHGWWDETVHELIGPDTARPNEMRLQQINRRLNDLAKALNVDVLRDPEDMSAVLSARYTQQPRPKSMTGGELEKFERRTYQQAIADVIQQGIKAETDKLRSERADEFKAWRAKHKR